MFNMNMEGTKWTIFNVAVSLFAESGYANVSIRDIASTAKIRPSSIYYHFESKNEILDCIIEYYDYYHNLFAPTIDQVLPYVETEPPQDVMKRLLFRYSPEMEEMMNKVFLIVTIEAFNGNAQADTVIEKNMFEGPKQQVEVLLRRMLAMGKIKPVDIGALTLAYSSLCHSVSLRMTSHHAVSWDEWMRSVEVLFSVLA